MFTTNLISDNYPSWFSKPFKMFQIPAYLKLSNSNLCTCSQSVGDTDNAVIFLTFSLFWTDCSFMHFFLKCSMLLLKKKAAPTNLADQCISVFWNITSQNSFQSFRLSVLFTLYPYCGSDTDPTKFRGIGSTLQVLPYSICQKALKAIQI